MHNAKHYLAVEMRNWFVLYIIQQKMKINACKLEDKRKNHEVASDGSQ